MRVGEFLKLKLEEKYLGNYIKNWDDSKIFKVAHITVEDGGVDPQWEIYLTSELYHQMMLEAREWQMAHNPTGGTPTPLELQDRWKVGTMESYSMSFSYNELPELVDIKQEDEAEEELDLEKCEQCGEEAWDGYICHACGMKII